jgi:hypothetical protein
LKYLLKGLMVRRSRSLMSHGWRREEEEEEEEEEEGELEREEGLDLMSGAL